MEGSEDYLPLWLEVRFRDRSWLFEMRADDDRAVVVGSHPLSDVRVAHDGVAATHFHFERAGGDVIVVPGYRASLRLNEAAILDPTPLAKSASLEFRGLRLDAEVHDVPPLHMLLQARHGTDRTLRHPDYLEGLPDEHDPTAADLRAASSSGSQNVTTEMTVSLPSDDDLSMRTTTAWRAPVEGEHLGPSGTVIMQLPSSDDDEAPVSTKRPGRRSSPPANRTLPQRLTFAPWTALRGPVHESPTAVDVPHPRTVAPTNPVPRRRATVAESGHSSPVPSHAVHTVTSSLAPTAKSIASTVRKPSPIEQLGITASKRPLRLAVAAVPACVVIALALVGAARLVRDVRPQLPGAAASLAPAASSSTPNPLPRSH